MPYFLFVTLFLSGVFLKAISLLDNLVTKSCTAFFDNFESLNLLFTPGLSGDFFVLDSLSTILSISIWVRTSPRFTGSGGGIAFALDSLSTILSISSWESSLLFLGTLGDKIFLCFARRSNSSSASVFVRRGPFCDGVVSSLGSLILVSRSIMASTSVSVISLFDGIVVDGAMKRDTAYLVMLLCTCLRLQATSLDFGIIKPTIDAWRSSRSSCLLGKHARITFWMQLLFQQWDFLHVQSFELFVFMFPT